MLHLIAHLYSIRIARSEFADLMEHLCYPLIDCSFSCFSLQFPAAEVQQMLVLAPRGWCVLLYCLSVPVPFIWLPSRSNSYTMLKSQFSHVVHLLISRTRCQVRTDFPVEEVIYLELSGNLYTVKLNVIFWVKFLGTIIKWWNTFVFSVHKPGNGVGLLIKCMQCKFNLCMWYLACSVNLL
jgi:hypothetical protein